VRRGKGESAPSSYIHIKKQTAIPLKQWRSEGQKQYLKHRLSQQKGKNSSSSPGKNSPAPTQEQKKESAGRGG